MRGTGISLGHILDYEDFFQIPTTAGHIVGGIQGGVETDGISLLVHQLTVRGPETGKLAEVQFYRGFVGEEFWSGYNLTINLVGFYLLLRFLLTLFLRLPRILCKRFIFLSKVIISGHIWTHPSFHKSFENGLFCKAGATLSTSLKERVLSLSSQRFMFF